ncbi:MAG: MFS transporter [Bacteroidota bacterium]
MQTTSGSSRYSGFYTLITVFFFWGFVAASNDILIPVFKDKLNLEQWQSQLVAFAFYVAYTVGSAIYIIISKSRGKDLLSTIGYKNGIALGLVVSAIGTLLFYPAAEMASFGLFISGLFIVGLGFSLQQTAANMLAIVMGSPETGAQRLSLAGGINNFGTTVGPLLVSFAIFGTVATDGVSIASIEAIKFPYLILGAAFILVAVIFKFSSVPNKIDLDREADQNATDTTKVIHRAGPLQYPQLVLGMIAIFIYVGVEVATVSNLPYFLEKENGISTNHVAPYISLYWASMMIGRWTSAVGAFNMSDGIKGIMRFVMPYIAFAVFIAVNRIMNHDVTPFYVYAFVIIFMIIGDVLSKKNPARQLLIFSLFGIAALFIGMLSTGPVATYSFISVGLFCSTLWPCIFALSIAGLGRHTNEGSNYLIMMIMGGGFISLLQGWLAEPDVIGVRYSYLVGVACFVYLAFYAVRTKAILKEQGIDYDVKKA